MSSGTASSNQRGCEDYCDIGVAMLREFARSKRTEQDHSQRVKAGNAFDKLLQLINVRVTLAQQREARA